MTRYPINKEKNISFPCSCLSIFISTSEFRICKEKGLKYACYVSSSVSIRFFFFFLSIPYEPHNKSYKCFTYIESCENGTLIYIYYVITLNESTLNTE